MTAVVRSTKRRHELNTSLVFFNGKLVKTHKARSPILIEKRLARIDSLQEKRFAKVDLAGEKLWRELSKKWEGLPLSKNYIVPNKISPAEQAALLRRLKRVSIWINNVLFEETHFSELPKDSKFASSSSNRKHNLVNRLQVLRSNSTILEQISAVEKGFTNEWFTPVKTGQKTK